jgi:hypothetical protein
MMIFFASQIRVDEPDSQHRQMNLPFDLLLGRKTFDIWAPYWPQHADAWLGVNAATSTEDKRVNRWVEFRYFAT